MTEQAHRHTERKPRTGIVAWIAATPLRQITAIAAVSLMLRVWTLSQMLAHNPLFAEPVLDDAVYIDAAQRFVDGAPAGAWFLAPLYPTLLGIVAKFLGGATIGMGLACSVSLACGVATTAVLALTAHQLAGARGAWITGLLHAAAPAFVFQDVIPAQEAPLSLLYAVAMLLGVVWYRHRSWWSVAGFGVVVGIAALGRGTAILMLPGALPLVLAAPSEAVAADRRTRRRVWISMVVAVAGALVVLLPAAARNSSVSGDFTPFTWSFGPNLYSANSPQSRDIGTYHTGDLGTDPNAMERNARRIAERHRGRPLRPSEISAYWTERTMAEYGTVGEIARHTGRKLLLLVADHPFGTSHALAAEARFSRWLRFAPGGEWWILALGVAGWWLVRSRHPIADLIALTATLTGAALVVIYPANRYRFALLVVSTVLTGAGLATLAEAEKRRRGIAIALAVTVAACAHVPSWSNMFPHMMSDNHANVGRMLLESGRQREAVTVLREADRNEPDSIVILAPLAAALDAVGDHEAAARAGGRHNEIVDTLPAGRVRRVLDLAERGRRDPAALAEAERLGQELAPTLLNDNLRAHLWANMALVAALRGDRDEADVRMTRAREFDPELRHLDDVASRMPR